MAADTLPTARVIVGTPDVFAVDPRRTVGINSSPLKVAPVHLPWERGRSITHIERQFLAFQIAP